MKKFTLLNFLALTLLIQVVFVNAAYAKSTVGWVSYTCNDRPVVSGMDCNAGYDAMGPKNSCMAGVATCPVGQIFSCESATCYTPSTGTAAAAACPTATIGGVTYSALTMALDSSKLGRLVQCGDNLVKSYFGPLAFNSDGSISNVLAGGAVTIKDSDGFKVISDKGLGSGATTSIDGNGVIMNVTSNTGGSNEERTIDTSNAYSLTISRVSNSMGEAAGGLLKIFNNDLMLGAAGKIQMGNYSNDGMGGPLTFSSYVDLNGTGLNVNVPTKISDAGGSNIGLQVNGRIRTGTSAAASNGGMWVSDIGFLGSTATGGVGIWNNSWDLTVDNFHNVNVSNGGLSVPSLKGITTNGNIKGLAFKLPNSGSISEDSSQNMVIQPWNNLVIGSNVTATNFGKYYFDTASVSVPAGTNASVSKTCTSGYAISCSISGAQYYLGNAAFDASNMRIQHVRIDQNWDNICWGTVFNPTGVAKTAKMTALCFDPSQTQW